MIVTRTLPLLLAALLSCSRATAKIEIASQSAFTEFMGERIVDLDSLDLSDPVVFQYPDRNCAGTEVTSIVVYYKVKGRGLYAELHGWYRNIDSIVVERAGIAVDSAYFEVRKQHTSKSFPLIFFECEDHKDNG